MTTPETRKKSAAAGAFGQATQATEKPAAATEGTADQAAQAAKDPSVLGAAETPIEPGGPGVGAAKSAQRVETTVDRPLDHVNAASLGLRQLTEAEAAELARFRALDAGPDERALMSQRLELDAYRRAFGEVRGVVVDAADVKGRRLARAATTIVQDGVKYTPDGDRRDVPVDFAAYTALVQIGAIVDTPWDELAAVPDPSPEP